MEGVFRTGEDSSSVIVLIMTRIRKWKPLNEMKNKQKYINMRRRMIL